jgi:hypothetical protein
MRKNWLGGWTAMQSPFPGMDPYLEQHWGDVHSSLVIYARDQLQLGLPEDLLARVEERVFVESSEGPCRAMFPDVRVIEHGPRGQAAVAVRDGVAVAEPYIIHVDEEPVTETFINVIDAGSGNRVVTVIEFLSMSNKTAGEGQDQYLKKQRELKLGQVSLVEIDLLRGGKRVLSISPQSIPAELRTPYQVCARRGWKADTVEIYRVPLRERLPTIRIPLRESDPDATLDLQALIDQCYRNGRYHKINYQFDPDPPFDADDNVWAAELLRAAGRRIP